jgi:molybdopterin synthase catalytic subunit
MKLTVRLFAALRERAGKSELALEDLPDGLDVGALKREIERRHPALGSLAQVRGAVGTEYVAETRRLADGETVALIPPVSGGAGNVEHGAFELRAGALDAAECLEYEAFDAMTRAEMARIFERCRAHVATSPERTLRMLVHHRIGTVEVGEASVVIAVASPHRDAAFAACRFLIDELKKSMPIWKKEIYADGGEWIGERS